MKEQKLKLDDSDRILISYIEDSYNDSYRDTRDYTDKYYKAKVHVGKLLNIIKNYLE